MDYLSFLLCLAITLAAFIFLLAFSKRGNGTKLPPGPPALPIVGNLFSLGTKPHISFTELANKYGPLMMLKLGQVHTVIISSAEVAKEALQKNDLAFSTRHVVDAVRALDHHKNSVAWLPVSAEWQYLRKICNSQIFSTSKLDANQALRRNKVNDLIAYVQKCCEDGVAVEISQAAFTTSLNLLSSTFFSVDLGTPTSDLARELRENIRAIMKEAGKPNLADYFPILKKMDPQGVRRRMDALFGKVMSLFKILINERLQRNRPLSSIQDHDVLDALLGINQDKKEEMIETSKIPYLLLDLFAAGTDTTTTTLEWAMAELLRNPEKLHKAKAELREIIGIGCPLEEHNIPQLQYLQAIVKETLRLHPPVPFLLPRKVDSDVQLLGFTIPKDTQVLVNVWAIGRDPRIWDNPTCFEPERFMGSDIDVKGRNFELIPFGAGRRICPGLPMAIRMVPLMLGTLIHGFEWRLEDGVLPEMMDMEENFGITLEKAQHIRAYPVRV